jgi:hypothetical protein
MTGTGSESGISKLGREQNELIGWSRLLGAFSARVGGPLFILGESRKKQPSFEMMREVICDDVCLWSS